MHIICIPQKLNRIFYILGLERIYYFSKYILEDIMSRLFRSFYSLLSRRTFRHPKLFQIRILYKLHPKHSGILLNL